MRSGRPGNSLRSNSPGRFSYAASNGHYDAIAHVAPGACPHMA